MVEKVKSKITDVINNNGFILSEVIYEKEGSTYFLRVIIDKKTGYVNINDCVKVNKLIGGLIDELDCDDSYILDICSCEKGSDINGCEEV